MSIPTEFAKRSKFHKELNKRVQRYFKDNDIQRTGNRAMWTKIAIILGTWLACAIVYNTVKLPIWAMVPLALLTGAAMAGIGMSVMHDANHRALSRNQKVNRAFGFTLDMLGAGSALWRIKHNAIHHTSPNIVGVDDDIEVGTWGRFAPGQPWYPWLRFQHIYLWFLYTLLTVKWVPSDFIELYKGRIGQNDIERPKAGDLAEFFVGKVIFFAWSLVIPGLVHGWGYALAFFAISYMTLGLILAVVFQLAHVVEEAQFTAPGEQALDFAQHQLATTVDFARGNRFVTWYVGGLNYQAVHHLFPNICHVHYPAISPIIEEVAAKHGVNYIVLPSVRAALASHYRWLKEMGRRDVAVDLNETPTDADALDAPATDAPAAAARSAG